jgi:hypothetical protein
MKVKEQELKEAYNKVLLEKDEYQKVMKQRQDRLD